MAVFEHDGIRFHYTLSNTGPTLVYCHGLGGDSGDSEELIGSLPKYRVLLWDCRAHGRTSPVGPQNKLTFSSFAKDLKALLSHLQITEFVLGGTSMGAAVATRFAIEYPTGVKGLVLVRPAWLNESLPEGLRLLPVLADQLDAYGSELGPIEFQKLGDYQSLQRRCPDAARALLDQFNKPQAVARSPRLRRIPNDWTIKHWQEVKSLTMPTLVLGNGEDFVHPLFYAQTWAKQVPQGQFVEIPPKVRDIGSHTRAFRTQLGPFLESV